MDKVLDLEGRRYPFEGTTPTVGEVVAGFVVRRVTDTTVYLDFARTPDEARAVELWEEARAAR